MTIGYLQVIQNMFRLTSEDRIGIHYITQKQALGRRPAARTRQIACRDDLLELSGRIPASPDIYQGADNGPHHVAQETVGTDPETQNIAATAPLRTIYMAYIGLVVRVELGERGKIVIPQQA